MRWCPSQFHKCLAPEDQSHDFWENVTSQMTNCWLTHIEQATISNTGGIDFISFAHEFKSSNANIVLKLHYTSAQPCAMEGEDLSDSDDYIELPFTSPSIRQEELAPLSGSVLLQPQYPNGIQNQLLARIASARRQKPLKVYGLNSNGPTTLPSFLALGKADTVGDGWRTDSGEPDGVMVINTLIQTRQFVQWLRNIFTSIVFREISRSSPIPKPASDFRSSYSGTNLSRFCRIHRATPHRSYHDTRSNGRRYSWRRCYIQSYWKLFVFSTI